MRLPRWVYAGIALAALSGVLLGVGGFTFGYAEGLSYFSTDPRACANCHIMWPQYDSWQHASHHTVATCVDCHLPHTFIAKYIAKAENGYHHSKGFTLQDFHEPIMIKTKNADILQHNCVMCHEGFIHDISAAAGADSMRCVHCHADVGHGERTGLGGPDRGAERELEYHE
ncbi:MAG: cytochrome c nitrite reductase small subunit [Candidatus Hydrogenedens sp.]|nr:cytochrome c nitrite reductase small subunit [Candidatus Hydrogenedens sp.]